MKFLHCHVSVTSRAKTKRTASASAAYRNGRGKFKNRKDQVLYTQVFAPKSAPNEFLSSEFLWRMVDYAEKRKDAQIFRELQTDLHNDLPLDEQVQKLTEFIQENFVSEGMIADLSIHKNKSGLHCHIMLTMRKIVTKNGITGFGKKNRDWNNLDLVAKWRLDWQNKLNQLAKQHNKEPVSLQSIEFEKQKALDSGDFVLAAELHIKQQTTLKHKSRPQYAEFMKNRQKTRKLFADSLLRQQQKRTTLRAEMQKEENFLKIIEELKSSVSVDSNLENLIDELLDKRNKQKNLLHSKLKLSKP